MTDNHPNKQNLQQKPATADSKTDSKKPDSTVIDQRTSTQKASSNDLKMANNSPKNNVKAAEPQMKMVNIVIADSTYGIFCPVHEEEDLRSAVHYINSFALDIKKNAPKLSQENLLVLSCLNLYEKIHDNNKLETDRKQQEDQTKALLNKVIKDAQSIL